MTKRKDKHAANYQVIEDGAVEDYRDRYLQQLIKRFDDPDYTGMPIVIDSEGLTIPEAADLVRIVKGLQSVIKVLKAKIFNEET